MKLFTVFYLLIGIGILVEVLRRLGFAFVRVRAIEKTTEATRGGSEKDADGNSVGSN